MSPVYEFCITFISQRHYCGKERWLVNQKTTQHGGESTWGPMRFMSFVMSACGNDPHPAVKPIKTHRSPHTIEFICQTSSNLCTVSAVR